MQRFEFFKAVGVEGGGDLGRCLKVLREEGSAVRVTVCRYLGRFDGWERGMRTFVVGRHTGWVGWGAHPIMYGLYEYTLAV